LDLQIDSGKNLRIAHAVGNITEFNDRIGHWRLHLSPAYPSSKSIRNVIPENRDALELKSCKPGFFQAAVCRAIGSTSRRRQVSTSKIKPRTGISSAPGDVGEGAVQRFWYGGRMARFHFSRLFRIRRRWSPRWRRAMPLERGQRLKVGSIQDIR